MRDSAQNAPQVVTDIQRRLNSAAVAPDPRRYEARALETLENELRTLRADRDQLQSRLSEARAGVEAMSKVGLAQLRIDEALQESAIRVTYIDSLVQRSSGDDAPDMTAEERQRLDRQLPPLLVNYRELLQGLSPPLHPR